MRTLGSEAGRSEERAARRPTWRNRASASGASPARRLRLYARSAHGMVSVVRRTGVLTRKSVSSPGPMRIGTVVSELSANRRTELLAQPFPVHCLLNKFTYETESAHALFSAHHPHLHSSRCLEARQPAFFAASAPSNLGEIEAHRSSFVRAFTRHVRRGSSSRDVARQLLVARGGPNHPVRREPRGPQVGASAAGPTLEDGP